MISRQVQGSLACVEEFIWSRYLTKLSSMTIVLVCAWVLKFTASTKIRKIPKNQQLRSFECFAVFRTLGVCRQVETIKNNDDLMAFHFGSCAVRKIIYLSRNRKIIKNFLHSYYFLGLTIFQQFNL